MTLVWDRDGLDWPNRAASRFVVAGGLRWHVQIMGKGPDLLLIHGTGSSTHSWRDLAPLLATEFRVIAPDIPGHGFTEALPTHRLSLPGMAKAITDLTRAVGATPSVAVGHSAGAAILARMCLDRLITPDRLVSLNGALIPLRGAPAHLFSPIAKLLASIPLVPWMFAWRATDQTVVDQLLRNTGSTLDAKGVALYGRLIRDPGHVAGALGMMAGWDLRPLEADLPTLRTPLNLIVGAEDHTVPPSDSARVRDMVPLGTLMTLPGLGHLSHEERPDAVANLILSSAAGGVPAKTRETAS